MTEVSLYDDDRLVDFIEIPKKVIDAAQVVGRWMRRHPHDPPISLCGVMLEPEEEKTDGDQAGGTRTDGSGEGLPGKGG